LSPGTPGGTLIARPWDRPARELELCLLSALYTKADLINDLTGIHGYRRYLEFCTFTTGHMFAQIDRTRLQCHRLMYHCPEGHSDGLELDFLSPSFDISSCIDEIRARGLRFDIILADPFHEYGPSLRDLEVAFDLIAPGGTVVVHDCLPPHPALAVPHYINGPWCGVTYKAYVDFVTGRDDLDYYTVHADYGCGVIRKLAAGERLPLFPSPGPEFSELVQRWRALGDDYDAAYRFLQRHHGPLLKLCGVEDFVRVEAAAREAPSQ
jgi:hypothetical protein